EAASDWRSGRRPAARERRTEPTGTVSFGEGVSLEVRINPGALDGPLFGGFTVGPACNEMRQLDAVDGLVIGEVHLDGCGRTAGAAAAASLRSIDCRAALRRGRRCGWFCATALRRAALRRAVLRRAITTTTETTTRPTASAALIAAAPRHHQRHVG